MYKKLSVYLVVLILLLSLTIPSNLVAANTTVAILQEVKGNVTVTIQGGKREFSAYNGMHVREGDSITTGAKSSVKIDFGGGNESTLGEKGMITLARLLETTNPNEIRMLSNHSKSEVTIKQQSGGLWSKVKRVFGAGNSHRVETSTAIMGVRGTLYFTNVDPVTGKEDISVLDGSVAIETGKGNTIQTALINPGQEAFVIDNAINLDMINFKELVDKTDATLVAQIILDMIEVATQRVEDAKNANAVLENDKSKENAITAIELALKAELTTIIAEKLVEGTKSSTKSEEVNRLLQQSQQSIVSLERETKALKSQSQIITEQVKNTSKTLGFTDREIQQITDEVNNNISNVITENTTTTTPTAPSSSTGGSTGPIQSPVTYIKHATYQKNITATGPIHSLNIVFNQNINPTGIDIKKLQLAINSSVYQLTGNYVQSHNVSKGTFTSYQHDGYSEIVINLTEADQAGIEAIRGTNRIMNLNLLTGWNSNYSISNSPITYVDVFSIHKNVIDTNYNLSWTYSGDNLVYKVYKADQTFDLDNPIRILSETEKSTILPISEIGNHDVFIGVYKQNSDTLVAWGYVVSP